MFLTADELRELTGYVRPSAQGRWLTRNGIPHYLDAQGRPIVVREALMPRSARRPDLSKLRI